MIASNTQRGYTAQRSIVSRDDAKRQAGHIIGHAIASELERRRGPFAAGARLGPEILHAA